MLRRFSATVYRINFRRGRKRTVQPVSWLFKSFRCEGIRNYIRMMAVKIERGRFSMCYKAGVPSPWAVVY